MSLNFEEEKELLKLKEKSAEKLIIMEHEKELDPIRLRTSNQRHLEDYKAQLQQQKFQRPQYKKPYHQRATPQK